MDEFKRFNFNLSFDRQKIAQVPEQLQIQRSLGFLREIGRIDPILKRWFLCADSRNKGLEHEVLLDEASFVREVQSWKDDDFAINDMSFVLWNGISNPLEGGLSLKYHARDRGSLPTGLEFSDAGALVRCLQNPRQGLVELISTALEFWPEIAWGVVAPNAYYRRQRTFADRQTVGWIGYCPQPLLAQDFPLVDELRATPAQGSIIVTCPGVMDEHNAQHLQKTAATDTRLVELGLLPMRH